ncbi:MAG: MFS transporter, partial [Actinomycetota bacterium]
MDDPVGGAGPSRTSALAPLRNPAFARLWVAAITSNIGTWMEALALGIYTQRSTGSATSTAAVAAAAFVPIAVFSPLGGALADHISRKLIIVGTSLVQATLAASLAVQFANGAPSQRLVLLVAFGSGVCGALGFPAYQAMLPDLVPPETLPGAIARSSAQYNRGRILGPVLAGGVIADDRCFGAAVVNAA